MVYIPCSLSLQLRLFSCYNGALRHLRVAGDGSIGQGLGYFERQWFLKI